MAMITIASKADVFDPDVFIWDDGSETKHSIPIWDDAVTLSRVRVRFAASTPRQQRALQHLLEQWFILVPSGKELAYPLVRALTEHHPVTRRGAREDLAEMMDSEAEWLWPNTVKLWQETGQALKAEVIPSAGHHKFEIAYYPRLGWAIVVADFSERPTQYYKRDILYAVEDAVRAGYAQVDWIEIAQDIPVYWPELPAVSVQTFREENDDGDEDNEEEE